jgi:hypothetical protein
MAAVFMITTSTVVIRTAIAPRWVAFIGFLLAAVPPFGSYFISWSIAVFPAWFSSSAFTSRSTTSGEIHWSARQCREQGLSSLFRT